MAQHVEVSGRVRVPAPAARAVLFFTPEGEREWVSGWHPEYVHPRDGALATGLVFRTHHQGESTLWLVSHCDLAAGAVDYVRVTPDSRMGIVSIRCTSVDAAVAETTVRYSLTALSSAGEMVLDAFALEFATMLRSWEEAIAARLRVAGN